MAMPKRPKGYNINVHIRDLTGEKLKEYAGSQEMTITDLINTALWYCQEEKIDLAIWTIKARRKQKAAKEPE